MAFVYRDGEEGLRQRLQELSGRRERETAHLPAELVRLYTRRLRGFVVGFLGLLGAALLYLTTAAWGLWRTTYPRDGAFLTYVLLGAVGLTALGLLLPRRFAKGLLRTRLRGLISSEGEPHAALDRLEHLRPAELAWERIERLERWSVAAPLMALSLLAPLVLHALVGFVFGWGEIGAREFDIWIGLSLAIVGHCHLVLAWRSFCFARDLAATPKKKLEERRGDGWRALGLVTVISLLPGIIFLFIPTVIVAATGVVFIPAIFAWARKTVAEERLTLTTYQTSLSLTPGELA